MTSKLAALADKRLLAVFIFGIAAGIPLSLAGGQVLQAWMTDEGVNLKTLGFYSLVGIPYTLKFLWSPLLDRFMPPLKGRRCGWILIFQLLLILTIASFSLTNPKNEPLMVAIVAFLVALTSASQDIVIDAHRREILETKELGIGTSLYVTGYRIGMLICYSGGLALSQFVSWPKVFLGLSMFYLLILGFTYFAPEPNLKNIGTPQTLQEAVIGPFKDFFSRAGSWEILFFILIFKLPDVMGASLAIRMYKDVGFTNLEIGAVSKTVGLTAMILGGIFAGGVLYRIGIFKSLVVFGILQTLGVMGYTALAMVGKNNLFFAIAVILEASTSGMGTTAYTAFMASITNKRFTGTQYALLTSLMGLPRVVFVSPLGILAASTGWPWFFTICTLMGIPGLLMLYRFRNWNTEESH